MPSPAPMSARTILALESTCDETAAAVVSREGGRFVVRSNVVASQYDLHEAFGGVVPEIASRAHVERVTAITQAALTEAGVTLDGIDAVAVTHRPGLIGCVLVTLSAAKAIAWSRGLPLVGVDHIHAHALSAVIEHAIELPAIALVVSGGHTALYRVAADRSLTLLGRTIDDAVGEAYDKVAAILELGYPGGPTVDAMAAEVAADDEQVAQAKAIKLPRSLLDRDRFDFSFSGLKTAVLYHVHGPSKTSGGLEKLDRSARARICWAFQQAVLDVLIGKLKRACDANVAADDRPRGVLLGGGVACNRGLRQRLDAFSRDTGLPVWIPSPAYCTDNAAMAAALAFHHLDHGETAGLDLEAIPTGR